jgi:diaminohydroxyphosphoribosylaminopyrimidine deaminase/5-amino-6-(5-phosphoribosylamino)uracil reductase
MSTKWTKNDTRCMAHALKIAQRGSFEVAPNPLVGAVIVDADGHILGSGWHEKFGGPHAEVNAFNSLPPENQERLNDCTWYVTLEPCNHTGQTPPCTELIARYKPRRVVVATVDPNPLVSGTGINRLRSLGIQVDVGCKEDEALWQNRRFIFAMKHQKPWVVLKWASTADGFLDPRLSHERTPKSGGVAITGEPARAVTHRWRAEEMGILIGVQTALVDEPTLNVRESKGRNPLRFVLDPQKRLPDSHSLFQETASQTKAIRIVSAEAVVSENENHCIWDQHDGISGLLHRLHTEYNINSLLIEGGAHTLNSFIAAGQWNELKRWTSPRVSEQGLMAPTKPHNAVLPPFVAHDGMAGEDKWDQWIHAGSIESLKESR